MTQYYVRFGDLPEGGRSEIGAAPNWMAAMMQTDSHEQGVSVYPINWHEGEKRWAIDCDNYASLGELCAQKRPAYMVTGDEVEDEDGYGAYGMDGEPLLQNVKIVREMEYKELWAPGWSSDEGYLETYLYDEEPRYLDDSLPFRERQEAYAKIINGSPIAGEMVVIHPHSIEKKGYVATKGLGDLMLMMNGFSLPQGPYTVEYKGEAWSIYWTGWADDDEINPLASEITKWVLRGSAVLVKK